MLQITPECHWQWNKVSVLFIFRAFFILHCGILCILHHTTALYIVCIYKYIYGCSHHPFLYLLQAMFLFTHLSSSSSLDSKIAHWWAGSFWDLDNQRPLLKSTNIPSLLENREGGKTRERSLAGSFFRSEWIDESSCCEETRTKCPDILVYWIPKSSASYISHMHYLICLANAEGSVDCRKIFGG